jgi:hypothetical protein
MSYLKGRNGYVVVMYCDCLFDLREREHLVSSSVEWKIILRWKFQEVVYGGMNWIEPAQDRDRRRALVNTITNFRVP